MREGGREGEGKKVEREKEKRGGEEEGLGITHWKGRSADCRAQGDKERPPGGG